jgi:hypothetical protein
MTILSWLACRSAEIKHGRRAADFYDTLFRKIARRSSGDNPDLSVGSGRLLIA